jgi:hypothetical protein
MQLEADNKAIAATLKLWANARDHQREIEDNMYEDAKTSADDYLAILNKRLKGEEQYSDAWMAIEREITAVKKDQADAQKKIDDKKTKDAKDAADAQRKLADDELQAAKDRLAGLSDEDFAAEWSRRQHEGGAAIMYSQLDQDIAAGKYAPGGAYSSTGGPTSQVSSNPNYITGNTINVTANNAEDLIASINDYARRNGGLRVPGGVTAVS